MAVIGTWLSPFPLPHCLPPLRVPFPCVHWNAAFLTLVGLQPHPACGERMAGAAVPWHQVSEQESSAQVSLPTWCAGKPSELPACEVLSMVWQQDVVNDAGTATEGSCSYVPSFLQMASGKTKQWSPRRASSYWETNHEQRGEGDSVRV